MRMRCGRRAVLEQCEGFDQGRRTADSASQTVSVVGEHVFAKATTGDGQKVPFHVSKGQLPGAKMAVWRAKAAPVVQSMLQPLWSEALQERG